MIENNKISKEIYYDKKSELEIIKKYQDLIIYVYNLTKKYPEKENLAVDIKESINDGLKKLIYAKKVYLKKDKLNYLFNVEANLNLLNIYIRISFKNKYITKKNYTAWSYKIFEIDDMLEKWVRFCQKP
ncbi:MAG: four helix bundle protein [Bacilli bacterium]|nr:four helix bundle protein [Bacilli bacterium]